MGIDSGYLSTTSQDGETPSRSPRCCGRHLLDLENRFTLARSAGGVRKVGHRLGSLRQVECRRYVGRNFGSSAFDLCRHRRRTVVRRWNDSPSGTVCLRRWKKKDPEEPEDHELGRSRGGFSTKIHLLCDRHGNPLHFHLTPGQAHESTALEVLLQGADENLFDENGDAIAWPVALAGDKGYRAEWI